RDSGGHPGHGDHDRGLGHRSGMSTMTASNPTKTASTEEIFARVQETDPRKIGRRKRLVFGAISLGALLAVYVFISTRPGVNPAVIPTVPAIISDFWQSLQSGQLFSAVGASLKRVIIGYLIGTSAAIIIGSLMGWIRVFEYFFDPIVEVMRPIPPLAYIPLILIWFGIGETSRIIVITLACFVTCIINVVAGMKEIPKVYVDAARTLGATRFYTCRRVALPATVPYIFTGLRIALAAAWTSLVAAELLAAQDGLGFLLQTGRQYFQTSQVMYVIATIGVLAFLMDRVFRLVQKRLYIGSEAM